MQFLNLFALLFFERDSRGGLRSYKGPVRQKTVLISEHSTYTYSAAYEPTGTTTG